MWILWYHASGVDWTVFWRCFRYGRFSVEDKLYYNSHQPWGCLWGWASEPSAECSQRPAKSSVSWWITRMFHTISFLHSLNCGAYWAFCSEAMVMCSSSYISLPFHTCAAVSTETHLYSCLCFCIHVNLQGDWPGWHVFSRKLIISCAFPFSFCVQRWRNTFYPPNLNYLTLSNNSDVFQLYYNFF